MKYKNTKTGAVFETSDEITGKDWVKLSPDIFNMLKEKQEEKLAEEQQEEEELAEEQQDEKETEEKPKRKRATKE